MKNKSDKKSNGYIDIIRKNFNKMYQRPFYRILLILTGLPTFIFLTLYKLFNKKSSSSLELEEMLKKQYEAENLHKKIYDKVLKSEKRKLEILDNKLDENSLNSKTEKIVKRKLEKKFREDLRELEKKNGIRKNSISDIFSDCLDSNVFIILSIITSFFMYLMIFIFSRPLLKYISERVFMVLFVIFGVIILVFTILYLSPLDPAKNILGEQSTPEKLAEFRKIYGLDKSYIEQLLDTFKKFITLDLGKSFVGNEDVFQSISARFPITLNLSFASLFVAVIIAIPSGIVSAIKQYSLFDYSFMLLALIGLSIPNFWLGLILILNFSIKLKWLPAMFDVNNLATLIMPAIVLGTSLSASVARMTRSSMLEVKNQEYITTARAKGLGEGRVVLKHILGNAMIPIVTVIGLQFGALLGGSATTEKVFNVNGLGNYIVEKQFIPDIPVVLAGVVYVSIVVSLVNLVVDILYAFLDPRIKSKIKNY